VSVIPLQCFSSQPPKKPQKKDDGDDAIKQLMDSVWKTINKMKPEDPSGGNGKGGSDNKPPKNNWEWIVGIGVIAYVVISQLSPQSNPANEMSWNEFCTALKTGRISGIQIVNKSYALIDMDSDESSNMGLRGMSAPSAWMRVGNADFFEMKISQAAQSMGLEPHDLPEISHTTKVVPYLFSLVGNFGLNVLMFVVVWYVVSKLLSRGLGSRGGGGMGGLGSMFNPAGKSHAKIVTENTGVKFADVAGCEEAKIEIMEFVNFLRNPQQYTALGAKIPKGAMLTGPPGTGKTLLAKATAGEAGVPFITANGSEFQEIFVGVGPQRVRELFKTAREKAPVILFIDEIDAIGKKRGSAQFGGNSERENTLNQLLVEMDGFNTSADLPVIVFAATNRSDVLDQALMRPGRFDRKIEVALPDIKGRASICKVHLKPLTTNLDKAEFSKKLAALLPGFSGADIANVCNESALIAAREGANAVNEKHFDSAIGRVVGGLEKRSRVLQETERKTVAYHEAGHVIAGWFFEHAEPTLKVSIVPRGRALGYAQLTPKELYLYSTEQIFHRMCQLFGGRVAEEVFFGRITSGAQDDLQKITNMAYSQVVMWGMDSEVGPVSFDMRQAQENFGQKPYSDETARLIDERVRKIVREAHKATTEMIELHREKLAALAETLMTKEILSKEEIAEIIGARPFGSKSTYDELVEGTGSYEEDTELPEGLKNWNKKTEEKTSNSDESDQNKEK